jgi:hypothetical protein
MADQRQWHRLFGMSWTDLLTDQPATVVTELDLSIQKQLLDVVILRKTAEPLTIRLPDGFEDLAEHNLISFKSYQETLDAWALDELVGHYVDYRKQTSPKTDDLLHETSFRRFAVSARFPQALSQSVPLERIQDGVYEVRHFSGVIRLVVVHQLPQEEQNAMLHLYSALPDLVRFGARTCRLRSPRTSTFLNQLFNRYQEEGVPMPFTPEEFERQGIELLSRDPSMIKRVLENLSVEERLEGIPVEKRLEGITLDELLHGLPPQLRAELLKRKEEGNGTPESS